MAPRPGGLRIESAVPLAQRGLKNIHATLRAAGFGVPSGVTVVWPQGRASCGLHPRHLGPKGLKNIHAALRAAGFGAPSGATVVWPQGRAGCGLSPRYSWPKELKKTITQPCRLRDLARPRGRRSFGLKARRVADYARGTLAERALKNIHPTLRAAAFNAPLGATVVWPQGRASCGMYPQNLSRKGAKKTIMQTCGLRKWARPRGRRSFGLKTKRFAGCARGTLAQRV